MAALFHDIGKSRVPVEVLNKTGVLTDGEWRQMTMYSKIVAAADGFDAATSRRAYKTVPINPAEVMREMRYNPRRGMDPVVVKAFINLTGIYPPGTLVVLDTFELGIVHAVNPITEMLSRPMARI